MRVAYRIASGFSTSFFARIGQENFGRDLVPSTRRKQPLAYQMVHRAASAGAAPALAYLQLSPLPTGGAPDFQQLLDDLGNLHGLLGNPEGFRFRLIELLVKPTKSFAAVADLPKGHPETAAVVKRALRGDALLEFEGAREYVVGTTRAVSAGGY
ncbi:MAG TPA: hypothetical protein VJN64_03375 [Terriglobales bacterium]|nr:hypothetical protein [Terriglobales bacterium]